MSDQDTICAVSTPAGSGGIGIIRMSGGDAVAIAARIFLPGKDRDLRQVSSHTIHYGRIVDPRDGSAVDEVLVTIMRKPATYTREDVVEINCHGGPAPMRKVLDLLVRSGARHAGPGEFTRRAFVNGRIDLAQAEAVMDIIRARTEAGNRAAQEQLGGGLSREIEALRQALIGLLAAVEASVDFPEEDIETPAETSLAQGIREMADKVRGILQGAAFGKILREGVAAAIVGRPNVGKSSLLNALLRENRAIVNDLPGTTRDSIEESISINGIAVRIIDTAGIRETHDMVEQEGVRRSMQALEQADLVLVVLDAAEPIHDGDQRVMQELAGRKAIAVINKSDRPRKLEKIHWPELQIEVSCREASGLDELRNAISAMVLEGAAAGRDHAWLVNERHADALKNGLASLEKALESAERKESPEFIALDLRDALESIGLIVGATYTEDILERVFRDFCIGK